MGLTVNRQMAKKLTVNRPKRNIFTVHRQMSEPKLAVKWPKNQPSTVKSAISKNNPFGHRCSIEGLLYFCEGRPYLASHVTTAEKALKLKLLTFYNNKYQCLESIVWHVLT